MSPPDLIRRQQATNRTIGRYRRRAFSWAEDANCLRLGAFHLRQMGHRTPAVPKFKTPLGAIRALDRAGFADMAEALDSVKSIRRIAPAMAMMGDLATLKGGVRHDEDASDDERAAAQRLADIGAIVVCMGPHKVLGWREDQPRMVVLDVGFDQLQAAWKL